MENCKKFTVAILLGVRVNGNRQKWKINPKKNAIHAG